MQNNQPQISFFKFNFNGVCLFYYFKRYHPLLEVN